MEVRNKDEQFILSTHFADWSKGGVSRLWLGVRCHVDIHTGDAHWLSHSTEMAPVYNQWGDNEPAEEQSCKIAYPIVSQKLKKNLFENL